MAFSVEILQHGTVSYQSFLDKESSKHYMIMKEPMYWTYTVVMSSKTWPFMEQLNRIVFFQQESGLRYYWQYLVKLFSVIVLLLLAQLIYSLQSASRTMNYDIQRNLEENGKPPTGGEPIKLSVEHVLGALFLLLFGTALATISFLVEMLLKHKNKLKV